MHVRLLESFGPLLDLMKLSNPTDQCLWIVDTKYGVALVLLFYCLSLLLSKFQKIKKNWGIPAYHEFPKFKKHKTDKDLKKSDIFQFFVF